MNDKQETEQSLDSFKSAYKVGRFVNLRPPVVQIIGVHFRQQGPGGPITPTYTILHDGQLDENVPESVILGYDDLAQRNYDNMKAAQHAAQREVSAAFAKGQLGANEGENTPYAEAEAPVALVDGAEKYSDHNGNGFRSSIDPETAGDAM